MRKKKLLWNTLSALLYQMTAVICGFVLPKAILDYYGSEVNGVINSIAQFLEMITFLELGVGTVIQSALYKPLADQEPLAIMQVLASGNSFFRKLAGALVVYVAALMVIYPVVIDAVFGFAFDASLILSMSISYFAQYYFGLVDSMLLRADQKGFIINIIDMVTLVMNTFFCYWLVSWGIPIQSVKFVTAGIFLLRPILIRIYILRHYHIDRNIKYEKDPVEQKWYGVAQHIAAIVLDSTDMVVLSIFSTMSDVSVYSVYLLVVAAIRNLFMRCANGVRSLFGELWAKQELKELSRIFGVTEWVVHTLILFIWCCTYALIGPFVEIYTANVTDINYHVPVFAALICIAYGLFCMRINFHNMILAAEHYKGTQWIYIVGAAMNLILSILAVGRWGLIGVTVGTIAALLFQVLYMARYVIVRLKLYSVAQMVKQYALDAVAVTFVLFVIGDMSNPDATWLGWIVLAVKESILIALCILAVNVVFYYREAMQKLRSILQKCCGRC